MEATGWIQAGEGVVMFGFGAGLAWGAAGIAWTAATMKLEAVATAAASARWLFGVLVESEGNVERTVAGGPR
ncbi:MAG: hypothetical protein OXP73_05390 [Chloroflexota bacterium]|nr:hypothetical protein [Chloroflexota bacterium]